MMKKILSVLLAVCMVAMLGVALASCGKDTNSDVKIGVILVGDENEGYTYAHIEGIKNAQKALGLKDNQILWKYSIGEDQTCYDAAKDLIEQGCTYVFSNSYGHQTFMQQAAKDYPNVRFVSMTGDTAKASGLANFSNAFTNVYESRYVSGVVAGLKIKELVEGNKLSANNFDGENVKVGYVGAYPYAEVVSGYTAFFLGIKSVYEKVTMEVKYTNSWFDITAEGTTAESLMADGCVIIGQHADSTGAPAAIEAKHKEGKEVYSVGYNVSMLSVAPTAALTSSTNNWGVYYTYALGQAVKGEAIATNWSEGYEKGAVAITDLGTSVAEGTKAKVDEVIAAIKAGTLHVFDVSTFTVSGESSAYVTDANKHLTSAFATDTNGDFVNDADNAVIDGYYHESYFQSAPSFSIRIDGIVEDASTIK